MAVAALVGCSFCLDFGYFQTHNQGLDETKASEVPRWRESSVFTPLERDVMEYAEAMRKTPPQVTDELFVTAPARAARRPGHGRAHSVERWDRVDQSQVRNPRAYLIRSVTRQALNRLRSLARRREDYVGQWPPEPLLTSPDVAADVELADSVSIAVLTVLETLGPAERAVFVLREVFEAPCDEIAEAVGESPAAARSPTALAAMSGPDARGRPSHEHVQREAVQFFLAAVRGGDLQGSSVNAALSFAVEDGRITRIFAMANPHKLEGLDRVAMLTRF